MIKVLIKPREVKISGHAKSAPKGQDLVCCSVSTLYSSLICNLLNDIKFDKKNDVIYNGLDGNAYVKIKKFNTKSYYSFKFFRVAIKKLQEEYPDFIEIDDRIDNAKSTK